MSTTKHLKARKVLNIERSYQEVEGETVKVTRILYCLVEGQTSRTIKTSSLIFAVYFGGPSNMGFSSRYLGKTVSLSIKDPMASKCMVALSSNQLDRVFKRAEGDAFRKYILHTPSLCKNVTGTVKWFRHDGEGYIETALGTFPVYACNIVGAKTWYPETACMYLKKGETVTFDLADMGDHLTPTKVRGNVYFDAEKWSKLDHSKLAFKVGSDGKLENGLFA